MLRFKLLSKKLPRHTNAGFTLIEMLVVIAIIGLLSSVVVIGLSGARQKARDARRIADIRQIQNALEIFYDAVTGYPTTLTPLPPNVPRNDPQGNNYQYVGTGTGIFRDGYELGINLEGSDNATSVVTDCPPGATTAPFFCVTPN